MVHVSFALLVTMPYGSMLFRRLRRLGSLTLGIVRHYALPLQYVYATMDSLPCQTGHLSCTGRAMIALTSEVNLISTGLMHCIKFAHIVDRAFVLLGEYNKSFRSVMPRSLTTCHCLKQDDVVACQACHAHLGEEAGRSRGRLGTRDLLCAAAAIRHHGHPARPAHLPG